MKRLIMPVAIAMLGATLTAPAVAQIGQPAPVMVPGNTLLSLSAEGRSTRSPDLAVFSAGVASSGKTAAAALAANSADMNRVIQSLKRAGIADRDIQTSNLSLNPVYEPQRPLPDGTMQPQELRIIGYQVSNNVTVRQRNLAEFGRVIDTLVSAGANQINGPNFQLDDSDAALDEARTAAMKKARARAELYSRATGLRVVRMLTISESGGYMPQPPGIYARATMADAASTPVAAGELSMTVNVSIQYELAP